MEDWTTILIVVVGIMFSFFKAKFNDSGNTDFEEESDTIDQEPYQAPVITRPTPEQPKKQPFIRTTPLPQEGSASTRNRPPTAEQPARKETGNDEFQINSVEEARKAIIWGEILQRKHF